MTTTILQPTTIAHIVWMQPDWVLDCSSLNVSLFTAHQDFRGRIQTLRLTSSSPSQLMLECAFQGTTHREYLTNTERTHFAFHIVDDTPSENPILQAVPCAYLFHANNNLGLTKQVPVDPPYLCTQEETRNLLFLAMPDWAPALIQQFPVRLKVHHPLNWPAKEHEPTYFKAYSLDGPNTKAPQLRGGRHPLGRPEEWPCNLSRLQSRIVLAAVLSHVRNLCAWTDVPVGTNIANSTDVPSTDEALLRILQDFAGIRQLWALPTVPYAAIPDLAQVRTEITIENYFGIDPYDDSAIVTSATINDTVQKILLEIQQVHAAALQC